MTHGQDGTVGDTVGTTVGPAVDPHVLLLHPVVIQMQQSFAVILVKLAYGFVSDLDRSTGPAIKNEICSP